MVNFTHRYDKLSQLVFPTVRSVNYMKEHKLSIGSIDEVTVKRDFLMGKAMLVSYFDSPISKIPLEFLQYDAAPMQCNNYQEYVDVLNSFIEFPSNTILTTKRILWWMWIGKK